LDQGLVLKKNKIKMGSNFLNEILWYKLWPIWKVKTQIVKIIHNQCFDSMLSISKSIPMKKLDMLFENYFQTLQVFFWNLSLRMQNEKVVNLQNDMPHNLVIFL
jgi:hypothetical protein